MLRKMLLSKIHRATITECDPDYVGSITIDEDLLRATGMRPNEAVWVLDIEAVEMRGQDPVPQAGAYSLTTPDAKTAAITFARVDEDTIECVLTAGSKSWTFQVSSTGEVDGEE